MIFQAFKRRALSVSSLAARPSVAKILSSSAIGLAMASLAPAAMAQTTLTYDTPASTGSFTVPAGVSEVELNSMGASGGLGNTATKRGGGGASVSATIPVTAGDVIYYVIGEQGIGGNASDGGGGGSSAFFLNGTLVMVSGGGAGYDNTGTRNGFANQGGRVQGPGGVANPGGAKGVSCPTQTNATGGNGGLGGGVECTGVSGNGGGINSAGGTAFGGAGGGGAADLNPLNG